MATRFGGFGGNKGRWGQNNGNGFQYRNNMNNGPRRNSRWGNTGEQKPYGSYNKNCELLEKNGCIIIMP